MPVVDKVVEALLGYGVPGLAFLGAMGVIWYLIRENDQLKKENKELHTQKDSLHEARLGDAKTYGDNMVKSKEDWEKFAEDVSDFLAKRGSNRGSFRG